MSKQVHFIVVVDLDTKEVHIDDETYAARFAREEQVWDTDKQAWEEDDQAFLYEEALAILNSTPIAKDGN